MVTVEIAYSVDREYRLVRHAADKAVWFAVKTGTAPTAPWKPAIVTTSFRVEAMREGDTVRIECAPQHRGTVCRAAGGMIPEKGKIVMVIDNHAYVYGVTRPFTKRRNGEWVMSGTRMDQGPRLVP